MSKKTEDQVEYIPNARPCPECSRRDHIRIMKMGAAWALTCDDCGYTVGPCALMRTAVKKWADENKAAKERKQTEQAVRAAGAIMMLPIGQLVNHPKNVRKAYTDIDDLAESIKARGVMQNLTVVPAPGHEEECDLFYVVIGNRRLQAARKAGLKELPCAVAWDMPEREQVSIMVTENMQRADLTLTEQAESFQLMLDLGETVDSVHEKTGLSKTTIYHRLKLAELGTDRIKKRQEKEGRTEAGNTYFQLGINDLIYLEHVKDIAQRRKILNDATDSKSLKYMVDNTVRLDKKNELKKKAAELLEGAGIHFKENIAYDYAAQTVVKFCVSDADAFKKLENFEIPAEYMDKKGKPRLYWGEDYEGILIKAVPEKKPETKEETEEDRKRKVMEREGKRLKELAKEVNAEVLRFVRDVCDDKYGKPKDEGSFMKSTWLHMIENTYSRETLRQAAAVYYGINLYGVGDDKMDKVRQMALWKQMLLCMIAMIAMREDSFGNLVNYGNNYNKEHGKAVKGILSTLAQFGFRLTDAQQADACYGTHEYYVNAGK